MITITKRDGREVEFDECKIINAILKAFKEVYPDKEDDDLKREYSIGAIAYDALTGIVNGTIKGGVEGIQDFVEIKLMGIDRQVAKAYILYRDKRSRYRHTVENLAKQYKHLNELINGDDEESNRENSNKDTRILPTMRDYIAGFTCRELAIDYILPKDIADAHKGGMIHVHDTDYSPTMPMTNCCLINLEDMLQNGTVISGTLIEKPHSFRTACTIVTQIITQVASSQYGGNSFSFAHLAPFVEESRKKYRRKYPEFSNDSIEKLVREEIKDGIQTIQYQLITMSTTNGQAPFVSAFAYLAEAKNEQEKKDLALIIEEVFKQRIEGVKNEQGIPVTTAFPKLLYVLEEQNMEDGEYYYLTKLAAECSAKRLVPDYISAKIMKETKGDVYPCIKTCA